MINVNIFLPDVFEQAKTQNNQYWVDKLTRDDFIRAHLAVLVESNLSLLLNGGKTIESRFSLRKIALFHQVSKGDVILLKKSGGAVTGVFEALEIHYFEPRSDLP
ncbi:MAG: hypothetical protein LBS84_05800 [Clostridiales bacterium]|jgi:hypothetical protein|nr:hypothetical protein [Clostridiales bacterium]